jgi:hypothetical protein
MPPLQPAKRFEEWFFEFIKEHEANCGGCGYSLNGIQTLQCPECGIDIDIDSVMGEPDYRSAYFEDDPIVQTRLGLLWVVLVALGALIVVLSLY